MRAGELRVPYDAHHGVMAADLGVLLSGSCASKQRHRTGAPARLWRGAAPTSAHECPDLLSRGDKASR